MITLYGVPRSRTLRAAWVLEELGIDWQFVFVDMGKGEHRSGEFLALNPCAKVPVLKDDDLLVSESAAMCMYLAEKYAQGSLVPQAGSRHSALHHQWMSFILTELEQPLWTLGKHKFALPEAIRHPSVMPSAVWEFERAAAQAEVMLPDSRYLLGDNLSIADIFLAHTLSWALISAQTLPPKLAAYHDRVMALTTRQTALAKMDAVVASRTR